MAAVGAGGTPTYRGEDRRGGAVVAASPFAPAFWVASVSLVAVWAVTTFALDPSETSRVDTVIVTDLLQAGGTMLAAAVGGMCLARWRLSGDAPSLWLGAATLTYAIVRLALVELLPLTVRGGLPEAFTGFVRPASLVVTAGLLMRGAVVPAVNSRLGGRRLLALTAAALGLFTALFAVAPALASLVDGAAAALPRSYARYNALGLMPLVWLVLAAVLLSRGARQRRWLFGWYGLLLLALALGELSRVLAPPPVTAGLLGREVMRSLGLLLALNGAGREVLHTYREASTRLARSEFTALTAEQRIRADQAAAEERAHEARSALAAIEGATRTLEHYHDRLPPETRQSLAGAVGAEIRRLQRLITPGEGAGAATALDLAKVVEPLAVRERARGAQVRVDVPASSVALGRDDCVEQALQALLDNARRYAPGRPVDIRAVPFGTWMTLRVEDDGPGVLPEEREAIFDRGVRGGAAEGVGGSGLGLYVAARLMREQGGDVWVDERPGGGASFVLALPAVSGIGDAAVAVDGGGDAREVAHGDALA